jgi:hypothetical protein
MLKKEVRRNEASRLGNSQSFLASLRSTRNDNYLPRKVS